MLGGSNIRCRKAVGSISPALLAGCCSVAQLGRPVTRWGRSFSAPLPGNDEIGIPRALLAINRVTC